MVIHPDTDYTYFGWWVREDADGMPAAAAPFYATVGGGVGPSPDGNNLPGGGATFEGPAVGQYAIHDPLDGKGEGGAFTATALLKARFGASDNVPDTGMSGTIDKFRLESASGGGNGITHISVGCCKVVAAAHVRRPASQMPPGGHPPGIGTASGGA